MANDIEKMNSYLSDYTVSNPPYKLLYLTAARIYLAERKLLDNYILNQITVAEFMQRNHTSQKLLGQIGIFDENRWPDYLKECAFTRASENFDVGARNNISDLLDEIVEISQKSGYNVSQYTDQSVSHYEKIKNIYQSVMDEIILSMKFRVGQNKAFEERELA